MIAFIPARGGSKGLPGKNIRLLNGKPLIAHTIEAALNAKSIDRVIVTTDSEQIADIAKRAGAEVPFLRPANLASDTASAVDVYLHAAEYMRDHFDVNTEKFMVLLPTSPLRTSHHIDEAAELFVKQKATTLISVTEADTPPSWYMRIDDSGYLHSANFGVQGSLVKNRQLNATYYIPNGAIYILDYSLLKNERTYYCDSTIPYVMKRNDSIDIDSIDDFEYVEYLMRKK